MAARCSARCATRSTPRTFVLPAAGANSKAQIIGLANGGTDTINAIKTASEFGIVAGGQKLAGLVIFINDIHALGLQKANGLLLTTAYYWDLNDRTRAFAERFAKRNNGKVPSMSQAGTYSSTLAYLRAPSRRSAQCQGRRRDRGGDARGRNLRRSAVRQDERARPTAASSTTCTWSRSRSPRIEEAVRRYYRIVATIPADRAFRPLSEGNCPLAK